MKRLQLPKDKFLRLAINITFIIVWLKLGSLFIVNKFLFKLTTEIFFFLAGILYKFGYVLYYGEYFYNLIESIIVGTPIILVTWYIWNGKIKLRPKITRSKD